MGQRSYRKDVPRLARREAMMNVRVSPNPCGRPLLDNVMGSVDTELILISFVDECGMSA